MIMLTGVKRLWKQVPPLGFVLHRFPIAALAMAIFTLVIIIKPNIRSDTPLSSALIGLIVGGYLCVIITLAREVMGGTRLYIIQALGVVTIVTLFWFHESLRLNTMMAFGAVLLMLGNAVGWRQPRNDLHIWDFTHKLWTSAVLAIVGSIIFVLGALSIQFALKTLLGVDINRLTEEIIIPLGLGFLAPLYWLSTLPAVDEPYDELYENPGFVSKAIGFLGTWLLAPLSLIYAVIVLIYGAKILINMSLPKGEIAQLTVPFLLIGTLTWLLLEPPFIQKTTLARWFRWLWFPVSLPVTLLLAIAVAVRISVYGYTESRFALALTVVWSFAVGIWFLLKRVNQRDIRLIPGIGAGLLLAGTFMAQPISINSQTLRAKKIVSELELVNDQNELVAIANPTVEQLEKLQSLKGKLAYLYRKKTLRSIKRVFPDVEALENAADIYKALGIEKLSSFDVPNQPLIKYKDDNDFTPITGYDFISRDYYYRDAEGVLDLTPKNTIISITQDDSILTITYSNGQKSIFDIVDAIMTIALDQKSPIFIDVDDRTRIFVRSYQIGKDQNTKKSKLNQFVFRVLVKEQ